jgi:hypothetical protein
MNDFEVKELHSQVQDMAQRLEGMESVLGDLLDMFVDEMGEE